MIKEITLRVSPREAGERKLLEKELAKVAGVAEQDINAWRIVKRSIDARKRIVMVNLTVRIALGEDKTVEQLFQPVDFQPVAADASTMVIVGAGPAGLFAA